MVTPAPSPFAVHWDLDPEVAFLNHGSFGACPRAGARGAGASCARELEREPVAVHGARARGRCSTRPAPSWRASSARSRRPGLRAERDDRRQHRAALARARARRRAAGRPTTPTTPAATRSTSSPSATGARVVVARVPFPIDASEAGASTPCSARSPPRTRLALVDHVTSPTGLVLPVAEHRARARRARRRHAGRRRARARHAAARRRRDSAPPTTPATATSGSARPRAPASCTCARDRQRGGPAARRSATARTPPRTDRSRFRLEFDWTGTDDPTRVPLRARRRSASSAALLPGGWPALMRAQPRARARRRAACCAARSASRRRPRRDDRRRWPPVPLAERRAGSAPARRRAIRCRRSCSTATASRCRSCPGRRRRAGCCASRPSSTTRSRSTNCSRARRARSGRAAHARRPQCLTRW